LASPAALPFRTNRAYVGRVRHRPTWAVQRPAVRGRRGALGCGPV